MANVTIGLGIVLLALGLGSYCVGTVRGLAKLPRLVTGGEVERPTAVAIQSAMSVLCGVFVLLCVRSFIKARRGDASASSSMK